MESSVNAMVGGEVDNLLGHCADEAVDADEIVRLHSVEAEGDMENRGGVTLHICKFWKEL